MSVTSKKHLPFCPITRTALIIGSRWTAQILRELLDHDARRFQDLQTAIDGITPAVLSNRLKMLEDAEIVERRLYEDHPPRAEYLLTSKGREMRGVIGAMRDWGAKHG
ncbi:MAG: helix-turn-helix domain-containing protein [Pseudomonadota bacterium]